MHQLQEALSNVHLNYSVQKLSLKIHKRGSEMISSNLHKDNREWSKDPKTAKYTMDPKAECFCQNNCLKNFNKL